MRSYLKIIFLISLFALKFLFRESSISNPALRSPANHSKSCQELINNFHGPHESNSTTEELLGSGAGGSVSLVSRSGRPLFVKKIYRSEKEYFNDTKALVFLHHLQELGYFNNRLKIIDPYQDDKLPKKFLVAYFVYHKGETLSDVLLHSPEKASELLRSYNEILKDLDMAISNSAKLKSRTEFPLYGTRAIHYQFDEFNIVIHSKNLLVTEDAMVLIDPH